MKTKPSTALQKNRQGKVKTINAVASIHKILDEIAGGKQLNCQMHSTSNETVFVFHNNGVCATFHVQELKPAKGGRVCNG